MDIGDVRLTRRGRRVLAFMVLMCVVGIYNYYFADRGLSVVSDMDNTKGLEIEAVMQRGILKGHHHTLDGEDPSEEMPDPKGTDIIQPNTPPSLTHMSLPPLTITRKGAQPRQHMYPAAVGAEENANPAPAPLGPAFEVSTPSPLGPAYRGEFVRGQDYATDARKWLNGTHTGPMREVSNLTVTSLEIRKAYVLKACGAHAPLFGFAGVVIAIAAPCAGVAFAVSKLSIGIATVGTTCMQPQLMTRSILPVVMAELLAIYGLIVAIIIISNLTNAAPDASFTRYPNFNGFAHLCAGCCVGFSGLASGVCIGVVGSHGVRCYGKQDKLFSSLVLILVFAEALGLYGLIVSLIICQKGSDASTCQLPTS
jgi:V-type H+-transporting ATPase proteolipid subunit